MEKVLHIASLTCQMSSSLPTVAQKAGMEQKKAIRATTLIKALEKPTLTSAQANSVDALGKKFEDLLNLSGEHHHGCFPYSLERERGINSKSQWEKLIGLGHSR